MKIAVMRLRLILLSAYAINQPRSLSSSSLGDLLATTTRLIPNGSIRYAMYQHIMGRSRVLYRETKEDAILMYMYGTGAENGRNPPFIPLSIWETGHKLTEAER
ncbi:MAG TPA: hypothetical protein VF605_12020 [Allosphingosinicella sp.]|jgi:hypothetical protein